MWEEKRVTPEEFEYHRRRTIEMLHPEEVQYLKECAALVDMSYEELMEEAAERVRNPDHYVSTGGNMSYEGIDWPRFWKAYFFVTNTKAEGEHFDWGFFRCSC